MRVPRFLLLALLATACPPLPNPGQVVVSCTMDAVRDPHVVQAVIDALAQGDFRAKLAGIIATLPGVTAEAVGCILRHLLGQLSADPSKAQQHQRARTYLLEHGYEVP